MIKCRSFMLMGGVLLLVTVLGGGCERSQPVRPRATGQVGQVEPAKPQVPTIKLLFTYGSEKKQWLDTVTKQFNREHHVIGSGEVIEVEAVPQGSGESIDEILAGERQVHLCSPASAAFIKLGNAQSRVQTGEDLIPATENLVLSPVIIAMWQPMAEALGWPEKALGWSDILAMAGKKEGWGAYGHPHWGQFKFGHTHPQFSNSGLISIFAEVYAAVGKVANLTLADVSKPTTAEFVRNIERAVVHYGSSTGFFGRKMLANGPEYLSAAVLYENMVIESCDPKYDLPFPVVAIYPREGTFWSDHPAGIVNRPWVTDKHKQAARIYLDYLLARPQQELALQFGFRPAMVDIPLTEPFNAAHGVDPQQPQTTLEVPSVEVINAILELWKQNKKHANVALVLDISGSMRGRKIDGARQGAVALLEMLSDQDTFSLIPFSSQAHWMIRQQPLQAHRQQATKAISGLFASGGTALYDAVGMAYDDLIKTASPGTIVAIVALTDGTDTGSKQRLPQLLEKITYDGENRNVRVFTIAYGHDASMKVLMDIAESTKAKAYEGDPTSIRQVFREIATFF